MCVFAEAFLRTLGFGTKICAEALPLLITETLKLQHS